MRLPLTLSMVLMIASAGCGKAQKDQVSADGSNGEPKRLTRSNQEPANLPLGVYPYPDSGAFIGQGWDTFHGTGTTGSCVRVEQARLEQSSFSLDVQEILSSYSLLRNVESSVSASYKGMGAKASVSVSTKRSRELKTDDQNVLFNYESLDGSTFAVPPGNFRTTMAVSDATLKFLSEGAKPFDRSALERTAQYGGGAIQLTDFASDLLDDPKAFRRVCGEGFVAAIHRGVRVQLVLTQSGASLAEKDSLRMSLSASGYGASGSATYSKSVATTNDITKLGYRIFQDGGVPIKPSLIAAQAGRLDVNSILPGSEEMMANPTAFRVVVVPYANVASGPGVELPTPLRMMTLGDYYIALNDVYNLVRDILASAKLNSETGVPEWSGVNSTLIEAYGGIRHLENVSDAILADLALLELVIAECYETRSACTIASAASGVRSKVDRQISERNITLNTDQLAARVSALSKESAALTAASKGASIEDPGRVTADKKREELDDARYAERLRFYQDSISSSGDLSSSFFLRFYWYLTQIPVPSSYLDPQMTLPAGSDVAQRQKALNDAIVQSTLTYRVAPWKEFFCGDVKSETLCVPDDILREMVEQYVVRVEGNAFTVTPPPPPPRRKCKWHKKITGGC